MTQEMLVSTIDSLREWEALAAEAAAQVESLKDQLKAEMNAQGTEELTVGKYILRWTSVLSQRFDSTALKKELPELYGRFTKQVASRRFTVSA